MCTLLLTGIGFFFYNPDKCASRAMHVWWL